MFSASLRLLRLRSGGVDIVLTHAPPRNPGDPDDPDEHVYRGFEAFLPLPEKYRLAYRVHGHIHMRYQPNRSRMLRYGETTIINAGGRYIPEIGNTDDRAVSDTSWNF